MTAMTQKMWLRNRGGRLSKSGIRLSRPALWQISRLCCCSSRL